MDWQGDTGDTRVTQAKKDCKAGQRPYTPNHPPTTNLGTDFDGRLHPGSSPRFVVLLGSSPGFRFVSYGEQFGKWRQ